MFSKKDSTAAFASITLFSGAASTAAYAIFKNLLYGPEIPNCTIMSQNTHKTVLSYDGASMGIFCFTSGCIGIVGYIIALIIDTAESKKKKQQLAEISNTRDRDDVQKM